MSRSALSFHRHRQHGGVSRWGAQPQPPSPCSTTLPPGGPATSVRWGLGRTRGTIRVPPHFSHTHSLLGLPELAPMVPPFLPSALSIRLVSPSRSWGGRGVWEASQGPESLALVWGQESLSFILSFPVKPIGTLEASDASCKAAEVTLTPPPASLQAPPRAKAKGSQRHRAHGGSTSQPTAAQRGRLRAAHWKGNSKP